MKDILINKKKLTILIVALVLVVTGVSYAYFEIFIKGSISDVTLSVGNMQLNITDDGLLTTNNLNPGDSVSKIFSVSNTGTIASKYTIYLSDVYNTFIDKEHLVYELISSNGHLKMM